MKEYIQQLSPDRLVPFQNHPYQVREDAAMDELVESIRLHGILSPLLARPKGASYELVSGHRRRSAAIGGAEAGIAHCAGAGEGNDRR